MLSCVVKSVVDVSIIVFDNTVQVETMKAERDAIECELKCATLDMKETFLSALKDGGNCNDAPLAFEAMARVYGPLQHQVQESLARQEGLMADINVSIIFM